MTIAELFVQLGVKGADTTGKALGGVKNGLGEVKAMSIEAKAAIIGAIYALERMMSSSAKTGTDLSNFAALTGLSAKELQQWQYAARQVGVESEDLTGSLKSVQTAMTNMLLGKGAPEGMAMLANKVGFDQSRARDTFYVMQQLQKFAQQVPKDVGNNMLKSFGLSEGVIAAMRRNAFNPETLKKAPTYNEGEIKQLDKVNVAWANLGAKMKMAMGHLTAKDGLKIVQEISAIADQVIRLSSALVTLAEKVKIFTLIGKVFEGWGMLLGIANNSLDRITKDKDGVGMGIAREYKNAVVGAGEALQGLDMTIADAITEKFTPKGGNGEKSQTVNVNQNLNFHHDGKDAQKTGHSVKKATQDAFRQIPAQAGGY